MEGRRSLPSPCVPFVHCLASVVTSFPPRPSSHFSLTLRSGVSALRSSLHSSLVPRGADGMEKGRVE